MQAVESAWFLQGRFKNPLKYKFVFSQIAWYILMRAVCQNQTKEKIMTPSINAVGFTLDQKQTDMIDTKLKRISYADDLIVDLLMKIKHDKAYSFDTTVNFKWGMQAHVTGEDYDFGAALNKMMDVLDNKIKKEKDKIQEKS